MAEHITEKVLLVAVPNGIWTDGKNKKLKISLVLSPFAEQKGNDAVENPWSECDILKDWVNKTRTWKNSDPLPAQLSFKLYQRESGGSGDTRGPELKNVFKAVEPDWTFLRESLSLTDPDKSPDGKPVDDKPSNHNTVDPSTPPTGVDVFAIGQALWKHLFLENEPWISPEKPITSSNGAAVAQPAELNRALRKGESTIEGITSDEMNLMIGCGLAMETAITTFPPLPAGAASKPADQAFAVAEAVRKLIPPNAQPVWTTALRRMDHVIQRQEQVGTAGSLSQTYAAELDGIQGGNIDEKQKRLGKEFHHRLSMLDSHPVLLRLLGLVIDVTVEVDEVALDAALKAAVKKGTLTDALKLALASDHAVEEGIFWETLKARSENFFIKGEIALTNGALTCITQATACVMNPYSRTFHAATKHWEESRLKPQDGCVDPAFLDTAQWNLEAGVRSVLRRHGFLRGIADEGGATVPSSEGITVFWREKPGKGSTPQSDLLKRHARDVEQGELAKGKADRWDEEKGDFFYAENLVMGYVPTICRRKGDVPSERWLSVTGRKLELKVPGFGKTLFWKDEMALIPTSSEAPQPLSGWIVDILDRVIIGGETKAVRMESWYYLLATASGFVVVQENVEIDYSNPDSGPVRKTEAKEGKDDQTKAVWDWLPATASATGKQQGSPLARLGKYVDFRGEWNAETGCFLASDATLIPGSGLAGRILTATGVSVHLLKDSEATKDPENGNGKENGNKHPETTLVRIPVAQTSVTQLRQTASSALTESYDSAAFAFLRGNFGKKKIKNAPSKTIGEVIEDAAKKGPLHFQGRGDKAMAIVERFEDGKPLTALKLPTIPTALRYVGMEGELMVFTIEPGEGWETGTTLEERLRSVKLRLAEKPHVRTLINSSGTELLIPTSVYQVSCRMEVKDGKAAFLAERIIESAPAVIVTLLRIEKTDFQGADARAIFLTSGSQEISGLVHFKSTRVIFAGLPDTATGFDEDETNAGWTPASSSGIWEDLGVRLGTRDYCRIKLHLDDKVDNIYHLDEVEVLWPDTASSYYARPLDSSGLPENELLLHILEPNPYGGMGPYPRKTANLVVTETTQIVSLPLGPPYSLPWRHWNHVPPKAGLLRISDTGTGDKKIEVVNLIQSRLGDIFDDPEIFRLAVYLPGAGRQLFDLPLRKDTLIGKQFEAWLELLSNSKPEGRQAILRNLADHSHGNGLAVTLRIDSTGLVRTLMLRRSGQLQVVGQENDAKFSWKTDGLAIPLAGKPADKGELLSIEFTNTDKPPTYIISAKPQDPSFLIQVQDVTDEMAKGPDGKDGEFIHSRSTALVIHGASGAGAFEPGTSLPAIVEVFADKTVVADPNISEKIAARRRDYGNHLRAAAASGFPLEVLAEPAIFIDNAHAFSADWTILQLSTQDNASATPIVPEKKSLVWIKITPDVISAEDFTDTTDTSAPQFSLVIRKIGATANYQTPLFSGLDFKTPKLATQPDIPKNDQIIADDVVMHWNGWSLATTPLHRIDDTPERILEDPLRAGELPLVVRPSEKFKLPRLRSGSHYDLAMRVMDIAGNVISLETYKDRSAPCSFLFHPFGQRKTSDPKVSKKPESFPLLRFSPFAPPLLWQSSPYPEPVNVNDADPALVTELTLFTDRAGLIESKPPSAPSNGKPSSNGNLASTKAPAPPPKDKDTSSPPRINGHAQSVTISLLLPPANWRLAEVLGEFDKSAKPGEAWTRIVEGRDWIRAAPYKRQRKFLEEALAKTETSIRVPASPVPDSVIDPDAAEFLVTINLPGEPFHGISNGKQTTDKAGSFILPAKAVTTDVRDIIIAPDKDDIPVAHNVPLDHPADLEQPPADFTGTTLLFRQDADVQLRIHGLPARNPVDKVTYQPNDDFIKKHFLRNFISWAAAVDEDFLSSTLNTLDQHGGRTNADVSSKDFEEMLKDLLKLLPDLPGRKLHFKDEEKDPSAYLRALASFLTHPWVSTPRMLRVRHVTNQPYQAPVAVAFEMLPRTPGQMHGDFRATFQVHRPSTGFLTIQTALEQEYVDDPRNDLPTVPDEEQIRIYEDPELQDRALARRRQQAEDVAAKRSQAVEQGKESPLKRQDLSSSLFLGRTDTDKSTLLMRPPLDLGMITPSVNSQVDPFGGEEISTSFVHDFQDTRHRKVYYRGVAHTRYGKEVVDPSLTETKPRTEHHYEENDAWKQIDVQATAAPVVPNVSDITVLFEWSSGGWRDGLWTSTRRGLWTSTGPKSWHFSRTRRCGHRLWIERPWYSSGSGEKLAILLWMDASIPWKDARGYCNLVSTWGVDPAVETRLPSDKFRDYPEGRPGLLTRENFVKPWSTHLGLEAIPPREAPPEGEKADETAPTLATAPDTSLPVGLAVFTPRFHPERKLWYVDVFTEPRSYSPFISYMVARYQPCSIKSMALSVPQRLHMLQALPVRTLSVDCTNNGVIEIKVRLSGIFPDYNHRRVIVAIEKNPYLEEMNREELEKDSDFNGYELGWEPVEIQDGSGISGDAVVVTDPEVKTTPAQPRGTVEVTVRLPYVPFHRSLLEVLENGNKEEHEWPCTCLRLTVAEQELYPACHHMLEDVRELPREIFSDQVLLPLELLNVSTVINPVKKTNRPAAPPATTK